MLNSIRALANKDNEFSFSAQELLEQYKMLKEKMHELLLESAEIEYPKSSRQGMWEEAQKSNEQEIRVFEGMVKQYSVKAMSDSACYELLLGVKDCLDMCMDRKAYIEDRLRRDNNGARIIAGVKL